MQFDPAKRVEWASLVARAVLKHGSFRNCGKALRSGYERTLTSKDT